MDTDNTIKIQKPNNYVSAVVEEIKNSLGGNKNVIIYVPDKLDVLSANQIPPTLSRDRFEKEILKEVGRLPENFKLDFVSGPFEEILQRIKSLKKSAVGNSFVIVPEMVVEKFNPTSASGNILSGEEYLKHRSDSVGDRGEPKYLWEFEPVLTVPQNTSEEIANQMLNDHKEAKDFWIRRASDEGAQLKLMTVPDISSLADYNRPNYSKTNVSSSEELKNTFSPKDFAVDESSSNPSGRIASINIPAQKSKTLTSSGNKRSQKSEMLRIRISADTPSSVPTEEENVSKLANSIDATIGQGARSGNYQRGVDESARILWRKGTDPIKLKSTIHQSSASLNVKDKTDLLKIADRLQDLTLAYPKTTRAFKSLIKDEDYAVEKIQAERRQQKLNKLYLEQTKDGLQVDPSEWRSPDDFSDEYLKKSNKALDNLSTSAHQIAQDLASRHVEAEYQEPGYSFPSIQTAAEPYIPPPGSAVSKAGRSVASSAGRIAGNLANNAKVAAETGIKRGLAKLAAAVAPTLAQIGAIAGITIALLLGFLGWLTSLIISTLLFTLGFLFFVIIILFIINSGAYMVPPGQDLEMYSNVYSSPFGHWDINCDAESGCPCGWPVQGPVAINQGPNYCLGGGSHCNLQAIDIQVSGVPVYATSDGLVSAFWNNCTGNTVTITSTCQGTQVTTVFMHLGSATALGNVQRGDEIGISDNTGSCTTGPHLHYGFQGNTIPMASPFIPEDIVPVQCCGVSSCAGPPCATSIP